MRKVACQSELRDPVNYPKTDLSKPSLIAKSRSGKDFVRKEDLEDGEYYYGDCRNAKCARWSEKDQEFTYMRTKFSHVFPERISHPDDFHGFDVFAPFFKCYPTERELVPPDEKE